MKRIISLLTSVVIAFTCLFTCAVNVSAAGRCIIAFSSKNVVVGDRVTVTVSISASEAMYAVQFALKYDPDVLKFQSGDSCSGGAGVLTVVDALDGVKSKSLSYSFKASKAGSCYISTADAAYVNENYEEVSLSNQGASLSVKDVSLSSNANLKSLKVSKGKLSPKFSASTTLYKVSVEKSVTDCNVYATAADADAKVTVEGGTNLKVGDNTCKVIVTAANGNQKIYKIVITRKKPVVSSSSKEESSVKETTSSKKPTSSKDESSSEEISSEEPTSSDELLSSEESSQSEISSEESSENEIEDIESGDSNYEADVVSFEEIEMDAKAEDSKKLYAMALTLEDIKVPNGFEISSVEYDETNVEVLKDKDENYTLYYLKNTKTKETEPYIIDKEIQSFKKLQHIEQKDRYYIFAEVPSDFSLPSGYYLTGSLISDFNINCYASNNPELSDFYYMYCFNGTGYDFYRYDTEEKIIQRYPELEMITLVDSDSIEQNDGLISRFQSLTTNAKIVVLGTIALILFVLILIILLVLKILGKRGQAAMVNEWDYDAFDNIEIDNSFSGANDGFLTEENDTEDSQEDIEEDVPEYLVDQDEE